MLYQDGKSSEPHHEWAKRGGLTFVSAFWFPLLFILDLSKPDFIFWIIDAYEKCRNRYRFLKEHQRHETLNTWNWKLWRPYLIERKQAHIFDFNFPVGTNTSNALAKESCRGEQSLNQKLTKKNPPETRVNQEFKCVWNQIRNTQIKCQNEGE